MTHLIVGLGNPGNGYVRTRHNAGFMLLQHLGTNWNNRFDALVTDMPTPAGKRWLMMPQTFMNRSGQAVQSMLQFYKWTPEHMLVVHDEVDLPFGTLRLKQGGGTAGHNGLEDIDRLCGNNYWRLRIGVGRPTTQQPLADYVLAPFSSTELAWLDTCWRALTPALRDSDVIAQLKKILTQLPPAPSTPPPTSAT